MDTPEAKQQLYVWRAKTEESAVIAGVHQGSVFNSLFICIADGYWMSHAYKKAPQNMMVANDIVLCYKDLKK